MELAIKAFLLGACFFTSIYVIAKISDKLQTKNDSESKEEEENKQ